MQTNHEIMERNLEDSDSKKNLFQIDFLKAFMIAFVIIDHSITYSRQWGWGFELWERMSIPVFMIILGFNMGNSFGNQGITTLKELYSWNYFKRKIWRFIFPYAIFYLISTTAGFLMYEESFPATFKENWFLEYIIYQKSLLEGPGNWFIPVLFQSIFLLPLLYYFFQKSPIATLISCFVIEFCFHLFLFAYIGPITSLEIFEKELYVGRYIILLYLSGIAIGFWFSRDHNVFSKKNVFIWILFPFSLVYMILWDFFGFRLQIDGSGLVRGDYNYITFIYAALIILIVLRIIPRNPKTKILKGFTSIGRATFHIYLVQDLFFAILYIEYNSIWTTPGFSGIVNILGSSANDFLTVSCLMILNWIFIMSIGVLWWYLEKRLRFFIQKRKS